MWIKFLNGLASSAVTFPGKINFIEGEYKYRQ